MNLLYLILAASIIAVIVSLVMFYKISKKSSGSKQMEHISNLIYNGSMTFLNKEYMILFVLLAIVALALLPFDYRMSLAFVFGSILSIIAGNISMRVATRANAKTAEESRKGIKGAFHLAFSTGVAGSILAFSLGLAGIIIVYLISKDTNILFSLGLGASFVALFMRVGGGIYTKSADVAADLSGKVEAGIPEDDPRNPAVIADLVGDNVGDIAGMGSDLFESFVGGIVAAMAIAATTSQIELPIIISAIGIFATFIGAMFIKGKNLHTALFKGFIATALIVIISAFFLTPRNIFYTILLGLASGISIGVITNYYTASNQAPTKKIAEAAQKGAALVVIQGLSNGMIATVTPVLIVALTIIFSFKLAGMYGLAIAAVGMLSVIGISLASDIYGSISDNAAGIAEICNLKEARETAEKLDELGNSTAAIGKGFAICSAALTALALLQSYIIVAGISVIDAMKADTISALFIGAVLPFIFCAYMMSSVSTTAQDLVEEVRKQFKNKNVMLGKVEPDYKKCIEITTSSSLKKLIFPGIAAITVPIIVGLLLGMEALGGMLVGSISTGFLLGVFMANAGASMDNAKKYIEAGHFGGKKSEAHKAAVVGDTVGDPLKDTAGPSLNILIKLMAITALLFAIIIKA
ncbi:MAG: sodium-translocating pyrophosphatase [archaeon]